MLKIKPVIAVLAGTLVVLHGNALAQNEPPPLATSSTVIYSGTIRGGLVSAYNHYTQPGVSIGLFGESTGINGRGVVGFATSSSGDTYGVIGRNYSSQGGGVYGHAHNTSGDATGLTGITQSENGRAVFAEARHPKGLNFGVFARSLSTQGRGVVGVVSATTGLNYGVIGRSFSSQGVGVWAHAPAAVGATTALRAEVNSAEGVAVVAVNQGKGKAAYFQGDVEVKGRLFVNEEEMCLLRHTTNMFQLTGSGELYIYPNPFFVNFIVTPVGQPMPNLRYYIEKPVHISNDQMTPDVVLDKLKIVDGVPNGFVRVTVLYYHCPGMSYPQ